MNAKKLLITGASGLLGWNLLRAAAARYDVHGIWHTTPVPGSSTNLVQLDLLQQDALEKLVDALEPEVVVHTAAMTQPGACEKDKDLAHRVNADLPRRLAKACAQSGARLIHLSTDLVFNGTKGTPYVEGDQPAPISFYGETKTNAEEFVAQSLPNHVILRSALIYGKSMTGTRGATEWMVNTVQKQGKVTLFTDEFRTPIFVDDLCTAILGLAESVATGIFHLGGPEQVTRYEFGLRTAARAGLDSESLIPASIADFAGIPPRTPDVSLDSSKLTDLLGLQLHDIDSALARLYPPGS